MEKTLLINAHPDYTNHDHHSIQLLDYFLEQLQNKFPHAETTTLNLYGEDIPQITESTYATYRKKIDGTPLSTVETDQFERSAFLLRQFKHHHRIVIAAPLLNFNISARLKDYIDNIMIARSVFRYTASGSEGLMTDNYRVLYLQSSGSIYTNNDRYAPLEFSNFYLKALFENIMGFDHYFIARSQGTDLQDANQAAIIKRASQEINTILPQFYQNN